MPAELRQPALAVVASSRDYRSAMVVLAGLALAFLGVALMTPQATSKLLDAERRYGPAWQRRAADTPRRRKQVRVFASLIGLCFVAVGLLSALGLLGEPTDT